jgi:TonB family protein
MPEAGLVQLHFGSIESRVEADLAAQTAALKRAIELLPRLGRPHAQLGRVMTLAGSPDQALAHFDRALQLEPELADEFLMMRMESYLALGRFDEARRTAELAESSPHLSANFRSRAAEAGRRIEAARREAEARRLAQLKAEVAARVAVLEPPPPPPPPKPPAKHGDIQYEVQARVATEILNAVLPEYPDALIQKGVAGNITLQVTVGADGRVTRAEVASSEIPALNSATADAVRKWQFRPGAGGAMRVVIRFRVL